MDLAGTVLAFAAVLAAGGAPARTCETRVEGPGAMTAPNPARDVILGRLSLQGLRGRLAVAPDGSVKVPLAIGTGPDVTLRIVPLSGTRARLDYDRSRWDEPRRLGQRAIRFEGCPPETPRFDGDGTVGGATGYNGGFRVGRPGCARLVATTPGEPVRRARIALGVAPRRCR